MDIGSGDHLNSRNQLHSWDELHSPDHARSPDHSRSLDELGDEIAELSAHLDAATSRLLGLIREFDFRGGWGHGFRSCAHWLNWRVGLDLGAARERVRVARALETLPLLSQALARGELSYAKVRALTRARRGRATRWWSTWTPRCWPIRISPASRCWRTVPTFPRKRPGAWRVTPAAW